MLLEDDVERGDNRVGIVSLSCKVPLTRHSEDNTDSETTGVDAGSPSIRCNARRMDVGEASTRVVSLNGNVHVPLAWYPGDVTPVLSTSDRYPAGCVHLGWTSVRPHKEREAYPYLET